MLNMFGMPCLGDPVCDDERQVQPPGLVQGTCMAALVPTGVWGIGNLQLEPTSTLPLDESTLEGMERDLKALGVTPLRMQWGSEEHRKFLTQVPPPQSIWALPDAAKNLRADCYARLFSG